MPFLKNNHHNLFEGKPLQLNNFICKDCTQKKKEYEYQRKTNKLPKNITNLGYIEISLGKFPIYVTTPVMVSPFGFNKENGTIYLQFTNVKTDHEMNSFYHFIQELEMKQMEYIGLNENEADLYLSQIRYDKEDRYDPNLIVKVPFTKNKYDVDIINKNGIASITNIYKFSKLQCDIYIDKIWKFNERYVCKWKVSKIALL
tara:strand:+ start:3767 stop:4369 length:603 start_codon:yes stop_codon:yes gene_type:complete